MAQPERSMLLARSWPQQHQRRAQTGHNRWMAQDPTAPRAHAYSLARFIDGSPSPFHVVDNGVALLTDAGYSRAEPGVPGAMTGQRFVQRDGSLIAWNTPDGLEPGAPLRLVGAHTDSPNLRLKPNPDANTHGYRRLGVEVYGGVLLNSWLDRDLGLSGRVSVRESADQASEHLVLLNSPLLRIPQLAIHLDREISEKGLKLNRQLHLSPIFGLGDTDGIYSLIADAIGVSTSDILATELMLHDINPSTLLGVNEEFLSAPRLDNQLSCHAALTALAGVNQSESISMVALFDHEEVGSVSQTGAATNALSRLLAQINTDLGGEEADLARSLDGGLCVSADNAHATHPNYPERHEPHHHIAMNGGPALKHNANQRYTTDSVTAGEFHLAAERAGVRTQAFVSRSDLRCGSTIGPTLAANLGIRALDVGCPQLAMHSCRELAGAHDAWDLTLLLAELLR